MIRKYVVRLLRFYSGLCLYLLVCCMYCSVCSPTLPTGDAKLCKRGSHALAVWKRIEMRRPMDWWRFSMAHWNLVWNLLGWTQSHCFEQNLPWHPDYLGLFYIEQYGDLHEATRPLPEQAIKAIILCPSQFLGGSNCLKALWSLGTIFTYSSVLSKGLQLASRWF